MEEWQKKTNCSKLEQTKTFEKNTGLVITISKNIFPI